MKTLGKETEYTVPVKIGDRDYNAIPDNSYLEYSIQLSNEDTKDLCDYLKQNQPIPFSCKSTRITKSVVGEFYVIYYSDYREFSPKITKIKIIPA